MPKISDAQIAGYASAAGIPPSSVGVAVAIAIAESGGRTEAYNGVGLDRSYGLWQINMIGSLGPDRRQRLGISSNDALFEPAINARAMAMISGNGSNWRDWTTYTGGAYLMFMGRGNAAAGNPDTSGIGSLLPVGLTTDPLSKTTEVFKTLGDPMFWRRTGVGALGVGVALLGAYFLMEKQGFSVVRKVESVL